MGCKIVDNSDDRAASSSLSDALLFTTMCIIGVPVEVQVKDGSIYSGIFHTACVEKDYGIVLKRARMTKKGKNDSNLEIGAIVDTLVVLSGDLVQVVAKGVILQVDGTVGSVAEDDIGAVNGCVHPTECLESEEVSPIYNKVDLKTSAADTTQISQIRSLDQNENRYTYDFINASSGDGLSGKSEELLGMSKGALPGNVDAMHQEKIEEVSTVSDYAGQIGKERSQRKKDQYDRQHEAHEEDTINKVQNSSSSMDTFHTKLKTVDGKNMGISSNNFPNEGYGACASRDPSFVKPDTQDCQRPASTDFLLDVSTSSTSGVDVPPQSCSTSLASSTSMVPPRGSGFNTSSKEFKLNPRAKTFSPSFAMPRTTTPAVPTVASMAYIPNNSPVVPVADVQPEIGVSPFAPRSSLPVKFVQYNNSVVGNEGSGSQYSQPIVGHVGSRPQPVRYAGQYPIQAGPPYVRPNTQPVMFGRLGQLLYVHPVSHGAAAVSQVSTRNLLTSHQAHFPKHQGSGTAPALHLCVAPPSIVAGGQHPFAIPTPIQLSQSPFPTIQPVPVPGANGLFGSKFP
ncbi:polyadenylate-binding protein-interacting protein 3 isoform X2 [Macadamia integrifolia]|uniref:polyadenylate-binding protein-interacting protein 3 isoform X2 n=1 Tax=Macadamia integrifolia TaxID=60698 RepID=UPI001C52C73C|nr:polyadenylate-binding protein-interacting protein 3 isoform X2 [Macadamia integrifolia]